MRSAWPEVCLGDVCELKYGKSLPEASRSGSGFGVFGSNGEVGQHESSLTDGTTIVIGRKGSFGEVTYSADACWPIDTTYFIDQTATNADLRWLYYRLKALPLKTLNRAAAIPGLNRDDAYAQRILLPSIEEQRRIAAVLDAADALRAKRRQSFSKLDLLSQAIFNDMFVKGQVAPTSRLGDVIATTSGGTPSRSRPEFFGGTIPWVKSGELAQGIVAVTEENITEAGLAGSSAKIMPVGTVLLAMYGATVGESAVLATEAATNQAVCCLQPNEQVSGPFILGFLRSQRRALIRKAAGGAQPNISQSIIRDLLIPLPSVEQQERYALLALKVSNATNRCAVGAEGLDRLFASLQQQAFKGEL